MIAILSPDRLDLDYCSDGMRLTTRIPRSGSCLG